MRVNGQPVAPEVMNFPLAIAMEANGVAIRVAVAVRSLLPDARAHIVKL